MPPYVPPHLQSVLCRKCKREMTYLGDTNAGLRRFRCMKPACGRELELKPAAQPPVPTPAEIVERAWTGHGAGWSQAEPLEGDDGEATERYDRSRRYARRASDRRRAGRAA